MEIKISSDRLHALEQAEAKLGALEAGGVENWEWYGASLEAFNKSQERKDAMYECMADMEVSFLEGAYEPSERGAGRCANDTARSNAEHVLTAFLKTWYQEK